MPRKQIKDDGVVCVESSPQQQANSLQGNQPGYVVELAKSGRAMCKKCDEKIELKSIRIGVMLEGDWGLFTSWQHLACTIFHKSCCSVENIEGYNAMNEKDKEEIRQRWADSQNEDDDDMAEVNPDDMVRSAWKHPAEPSTDLLMPLLPYQKEGLGWMLNQEGISVAGAEAEGLSGRNITFGGILADEMGMGKTIQAISLMLTNRPSLKDSNTLANWDASDLSHDFKGTAKERGGTLLVLPTVAIRQWQTEISRFTREGSLTVKVYHGSDRSTSVEDLLDFDVVITSYKVLEMEYRKETAGVKVECRICGKKFYPEKLRLHRKYFCGETAQRTAAQSKTQKKRARPGSSTKSRATGSGSSDDEDSDDDEIARQKKANKKASLTTTSKISSKSKALINSDSEEDEIAKQKKANKLKSTSNPSPKSGTSSSTKPPAASISKQTSLKKTPSKAKANKDLSSSSDDNETASKPKKLPSSSSKTPAARTASKSKTTSNAKTSVSMQSSSINDLSTSSEDEIARQKLENKKRAAAAEAEAEAAKTSSSSKKNISGKKRSLTKTPDVSSSDKKRSRRNNGVKGKALFDPSDSDDQEEVVLVDSSSDDIVKASVENNVNQLLSFDSSDEIKQTPRSSARKSQQQSSRTVTPASNRRAGSKALEEKAMDVDVSLVEDIFKSPFRRPQRKAAIAAAAKSAQQLKSHDDNSMDENSSEDEVISQASDIEDTSRSGNSRISDPDSDDPVPSTSLSAKKTRAAAPKRQSKSEKSTSKLMVVDDSDVMDLSEAELPGSAKKSTSSRKSTPLSTARRSKSTASSSSKTMKSITSSAKSNKKKRKNDTDDDEEYFMEEDGEEESDEDDSDNNDENSLNADSESDDGKIKKTSKNNKKSTATVVHKNTNKKSKGGSTPSADEEYNEEVEEDIQLAMSMHLKAMKKANAPKSLLHRISWFRIILDEAHMIKDRSTSTCKAVFNLVSLNKWCLTGTPLQNRVGELYSLIRFLRIDPHAFYFCRTKDCTCKSLHYRFTNSRCDDCSHSVIQHFCHFNRHILNPIQRCGYVNEGRRAMLKLKHQILDNILLRRTKTTRADDIQLPMRIVQVRQERMDEKEEDFYQALYTQSQAQFNTYLMSGTVLNNYAHIFDILIRLRQAVDHPYLVIYSDSQGNNTAVTAAAAAADAASRSRRDAAAMTQQQSRQLHEEESGESAGVCGLCQDPLEDAVTTACEHCFCRACITDFIDTVSSNNSNSSGLRCPHCDEPLTLRLANETTSKDEALITNSNLANSIWNEAKRRRKSILDKIDLRSFQTSTKMEALMEELYRMEEEDVGAKAIVFSQFVNMLDLLEYRIQVGGIGCVKLSGSMTIEQRDKIITSFKEDSSIRVLLISLKAGGVALNLTVASRIFLMDPWWNPAAEMQAIDRTHRIGQYKPIFATRFIIEDSIEERILKLQEKKKLVFDGTVGGDSGSMAKLTVDDMRFLFQ